MALVKTFASIGGLAATYSLYNITSTAYHFFRPSSLPRYLSKDPSRASWALITGATDGIGLAISNELLASGFNVLLHGRNEEKLQKTVTDLLKANPGRSIEYVVADASSAGEAEIAAIVAQASNLPNGGTLRVLVNNVGMAPNLTVAESAGASIDEQINVNIRFPTQLTAALLPVMTKSTPALILNMGSIVAAFHLPYLVTYSSCKSFALTFSASLGKELQAEGHDVEVLGFIIGATDTPGARVSTREDSVPNALTPNSVARACLDRVGCGKWWASGAWGHFLVHKIGCLLPESVLTGQMRGLYIKHQKAK
jgi:17beta-estradiol 17-dehydrogenase / very-long-chain 3-oxoacyl-CoA reductase